MPFYLFPEDNWSGEFLFTLSNFILLIVEIFLLYGGLCFFGDGIDTFSILYTHRNRKVIVDGLIATKKAQNVQGEIILFPFQDPSIVVIAVLCSLVKDWLS